MRPSTRRIVGALALAIACGGASGCKRRHPVGAGGIDATIARLLAAPVTAPTPDVATVLRFAEDSDAVLVALDEALLPMGKNAVDPALDRLVVAYFVAGAVRFDLAHPAEARTPWADIGPALRAALFEYRALRGLDAHYRVPIYERFDELERTGGLDGFVAALANRRAGGL